MFSVLTQWKSFCGTILGQSIHICHDSCVRLRTHSLTMNLHVYICVSIEHWASQYSKHATFLVCLQSFRRIFLVAKLLLVSKGHNTHNRKCVYQQNKQSKGRDEHQPICCTLSKRQPPCAVPARPPTQFL